MPKSQVPKSQVPKSKVPRPVWIEPEPLPAAWVELGLHQHPMVAELLYRRGVRDAAAARDLLASRPRAAPDPYRLPNMVRAVARVCGALENGERIAVYGDYDADGITATALLARALGAAGDPHRVMTRLPTRAEGYGLHRPAIDAIAASDATLLIAVDCASTDYEQVAYARQRGLDVLILDHHQMSDRGPEGAIVISPQLAPDGSYRELAAVGLTYLLVAALAQAGCRVDGDGGEPETDLLDYVALGTVADVAPLSGVNRALVRDGLTRLQERPRPGLAALCRQAGVDPKAVTAETIAFRLAPRLNAAGRLDDPALALRLLLTDDPAEAAALAAQLETFNQTRRATTEQMLQDADDILRQQPGWEARRLLVVTGQGWTGGVLGIAAARLAEQHGRPVILLSDDGTLCRGSARSVPGFDIAQALHACRDLLQAHGGHSQAAGLTVATSNLARLTTRLEASLAAAGLEVPISPELRLDAELPHRLLSLETVTQIASLEPFGAANERPLFYIPRTRVTRYSTIGSDRSHLKLQLATESGSVEAVCWGAAGRSRELVTEPTIDLAATLEINHWNGRNRLQLMVKDFRPAAPGRRA